MSTTHYPSLELCKKLTEVGFPDTQYWYVNFDIDSWYPYWRDNSEEYFYIKSEFVISWRKYEKWRKNDIWISDLTKDKDEIKEEDVIRYVCPSVMEMLDIIYIPLHHRISIDKMFDIDDWIWHKVSFYSSEHFNNTLKWFQWTLPNALAEMILWLHENNYISFSE